MKTELLHIDAIPGEQELLTLLGKNVFTCCQSVCKAIVSQLSPDIELWDDAGRRGKYFHGYRAEKRPIVIDMYLDSIDGHGRCKCEFLSIYRYFEKIKRRMDTFCQKVQESINETIKLKKLYGGTNLTIIVNDETIEDVLKIVSLLSYSRPIRKRTI